MNKIRFHRQVGFAAAAVAIALMGARFAAADDRLLGMVEPVVAKKTYRIAYASADMNSDLFIAKAYGVLEEAKLANVEVVRVVSAGGYGKVAEQIAQLEQLGTLGLDAIIVMGSAYDGYDRVVERLVDKGIKVITAGSLISAPKVSFGVIQDEPKLGGLLADYICQRKPNSTVITLPGPAGAEWNKRRFEGFQAGAATCGLKLVGNTFGGKITIDEGQRQAGDMLLKYPDSDYIYAVAGILAVGAAQQAKRMQAKAKIVTGTVTRRTIELVKDGSIAVVMSEAPIVFGRAAVQYTVRLLDGLPMPKMVKGVDPFPVTVVPNTPITAETLEHYDLTTYDLPPEGWLPPQLQ